MVKIYSFNYELESVAFEVVLRANGIPFEIRRFGDASYPGLHEAAMGWGELWVDGKDAKRAIEVLSENINQVELGEQESPVTEQPTPQRGRWFIHLFYLVLLCALGFYCYSLRGRIEKLETGYHPLFRMEWSDDGDVLFDYHRKTSNLIEAMYDTNRNDIFEKRITYSLDKMLYTIFYDIDENGVAERLELFEKDGLRLQEDFDRNQNFILDSLVTYIANGSRMVQVDDDFSGTFDTFLNIDANDSLVAKRSIGELNEWIRSPKE
jgi:hypothetical protein